MSAANNELIVSLLQSTLDSVTDGVLVVDLAGKMILHNRQFERQWEIPPEVMTNEDHEIILNYIQNQFEDPQGFLDRVREFYSQPQKVGYDTLNSLDGRVFERQTRPLKMGDKIVGRIWSFRDVSQSYKAERARLVQEERYRNIFDHAPVGIIHSTFDGKIIDCNPTLARIFGYESPQELISLVNQTSVPDVMYVNPQVRVDFAAKAADSPGRWFAGEVKYFRKDSSIFVGRVGFRVIPGTDGTIEGFVEDITERKLTEEKLRNSERFLRHTEKIARIGGWKVNPIADSVNWTEGVYNIVEAPLDYKPCMEDGLKFYAPPYRSILREALIKAVEQSEPFNVEAEVITRNGKHIWCEVRGLLRVEDGDLPQIVGTFQDITERKQAEDALRESENRYRTLFQSLKDLINMHSERLQHENQSVVLRTLPDVSKDLEMNYIENALRKTKGKVQPAAKLLGISRFALTRQIAKMGINVADYK
ncbi:MAG: PAS domain S-box protein [Desulfomonilaceae bacterium]